jgi:hypothetical protein
MTGDTGSAGGECSGGGRRGTEAVAPDLNTVIGFKGDRGLLHWAGRGPPVSGPWFGFCVLRGVFRGIPSNQASVSADAAIGSRRIL